MIKTLLIILLMLLPLFGGLIIGRFSPYTEGNHITTFMAIYSTISSILIFLIFYITNRYKDSFIQPTLPGIILFIIGMIMFGIAGLASGPDLSIKMLDHPEREHLRYSLLFIGAILFGFYFIHLFYKNLLNLKSHSKWLMIFLFIISFIELLWEFYHHYNYPEALKLWIESGNKFEDFSKNYDTNLVGSIGSFGRFTLYITILWLSIELYKVKRVNLWTPIFTTFLCILGIISSIVMYSYFNYKIETPKELGFLILFFIPGIPFLIIYWIGIGMLTRKM